MNTPYIDQFVTLARAYERVERGREEEVHGYMGKLQHSLDHPALGYLRPASWSLVGTRGARELGEASAKGRDEIHGHLEEAAQHIHAGDSHGAMMRLHLAAGAAEKAGLRTTARTLHTHVKVLLDEGAASHMATPRQAPEAPRLQKFIVPQFDTA